MSTGSDHQRRRSKNPGGKFKKKEKIVGPFSITREWVGEWRAMKDAGKVEFALKIIFQEELVEEIGQILENQEINPELYANVVGILMEFSRSIQVKLRYFVFYFVPIIVYRVLKSCQTKEDTLSLEVLLRTIYEVDRSTRVECGPNFGSPIVTRIPNINHVSIYSQPTLKYMFLPPIRSFFRRSDKKIPVLIRSKPEPNILQVMGRRKIEFQDGRLRGSERLVLCSEIWWMFNHTIPRIPPFPIPIFLKYISKIVTEGFGLGVDQSSVMGEEKRIRVSPPLLIEMIQTTFYTIFNGGPLMGEKVLLEISQRAEYDLVPEAMAVAESVKNYIKLTWHTDKGNWRTRTILIQKERNFHLQFESVPRYTPFWKLMQDPNLIKENTGETDGDLERDFSELSAIPKPLSSSSGSHQGQKVKDLHKKPAEGSEKERSHSHRSLPKSLKKLADTFSNKNKHKK